MKVRLFDTLAMVALRVGQAKESLLEEGAVVMSALDSAVVKGEEHIMNALFFVPEGKGNILDAMGITDSSNTILTPSVCSGACVFVGEIL